MMLYDDDDDSLKVQDSVDKRTATTTALLIYASFLHVSPKLNIPQHMFYV